MEININNIKRVYFIGIGGIGMSALARYFNHLGKKVAGYDSTESPLTNKLVSESIGIHFTDDINEIPNDFITNKEHTLVVYTPAIPNNHTELQFFKNNNYQMVKRAKALGIIANSCITAAIAGTHGKTSTSSLLAHILSQTPQGCNAFLGGIAKNFESNLVLNDKGANRLIVEADEFDRSFLHLKPKLAVITSIDADHLDIYKTYKGVVDAFKDFVSGIQNGGVLIIKKGHEDIASANKSIKVYTYSMSQKADFWAKNIAGSEGHYSFDLVTPLGTYKGLKLGILGKYNIENAIAASAAAIIWGINNQELHNGLSTFKGIARRFDLQFKGHTSIYIDDYAHHPEELKAAISSVRDMFPKRKITGVFQPHLYSRTNDFTNEFAQSLSLLDELILLDIYPAREQPIPGVTSEIILNRVTCTQKSICTLNQLVSTLKEMPIDILLTLGAGSIDRVVTDIVQMLKERDS
ncbi:MAG: UDP-N-acetylmuramate--L-alanine ligase [Bacteroidales bacterium]